MEHQALRFGVYTLDLAGARLLRDGEIVPLPPKAFAVLNYLLERRGKLVDKDELLDAVWGRRFVSEGVLKNTIQILRQALDDDPRTPRYIETAHRLGYRFIAEVVAGQPPVSTALPSPFTPAPLLVGRADLLAELGQSLDKAIRREPQIVFLSGEPGIGKTTLIEAFVHANAARPTGRGQCVEQYGQGEPYLPVLEALNDLIKRDEDRLRPLLRQVAPTWLAQLPWYMGAGDHAFLQQMVAGASQMRMLREFGELLSRCTVDQPLILVLEDLHWSDHATLDLLAYLARRRQPARWMILGTYRPAEVLMAEHPLRAMKRELQIQDLCRELQLGLLPLTAVADYIERRFPEKSMPGHLVHAIFARTEGLPFFLAELLENLPDPLPPADAVVAGLPAGVRQLIEQQFERLQPLDQRLLEAASVAGVTFAAEAVAAVLGRATADVEEHCEQLAKPRHFLSPADTKGIGNYSFSHVFYHEFAYARVTPARRAEWHRCLGLWLEASDRKTDEAATELALHFERGQDFAKAAQYLHQAAMCAIRRYAPHEAANLLQQGLSLLKERLPDTPENTRWATEMYAALVPMLYAIKGYAAPELRQIFDKVLEQTRRLDDPRQLFPVPWSRWAFHCVGAEFKTAMECAHEILADAERSGDVTWLLGGFQALGTTEWHLGELEAAHAHLQRGLEHHDPEQHSALALVLGHDPAVACRLFDGLVLWLMGFPERATASTNEALAQAEAPAHPFTLCLALLGAAWLQLGLRNPCGVVRYGDRLDRLASEHGFALWQAMAAMMKAWALAAQGEIEAGIDLAEKGLEAFRATGARMLQPFYFALLADACANAGRTEKALALLSDAFAEIDGHGERFFEAELHRLHGEILLQGVNADPAKAESSFHRALAVARHQGAKSLELRAAISLGRLWMSRNRKREARELLDGISRWFTEGFGSKDLQEARDLLDSLGETDA